MNGLVLTKFFLIFYYIVDISLTIINLNIRILKIYIEIIYKRTKKFQKLMVIYIYFRVMVCVRVR